MDLGQEPYQTELDELVEKEIATVVMKIEERKKKKDKKKGHLLSLLPSPTK
jgi:hypothetical protein